MRDHPVPDREQLVLGRANLGATHCAAAHLGCLDQHLPPSQSITLDLPSVVIEAFQPLLEPLSRRPHGLDRSLRLQVRSTRPPDGRAPSSSARPPRSPPWSLPARRNARLHVLPRHRRSVSRAVGSSAMRNEGHCRRLSRRSRCGGGPRSRRGGGDGDGGAAARTSWRGRQAGVHKDEWMHAYAALPCGLSAEGRDGLVVRWSGEGWLARAGFGVWGHRGATPGRAAPGSPPVSQGSMRHCVRTRERGQYAAHRPAASGPRVTRCRHGGIEPLQEPGFAQARDCGPSDDRVGRSAYLAAGTRLDRPLQHQDAAPDRGRGRRALRDRGSVDGSGPAARRRGTVDSGPHRSGGP